MEPNRLSELLIGSEPTPDELASLLSDAARRQWPAAMQNGFVPIGKKAGRHSLGTIEKTCPTCGKVFVRRNRIPEKNRVYCSVKCAVAAHRVATIGRVQRICEHCGKDFVGQANRRFCGVQCARDAKLNNRDAVIGLWNDGRTVWEIRTQLKLSKPRVYQILTRHADKLNCAVGDRVADKPRLMTECLQCGNSFVGKNSKTFCSITCHAKHTAANRTASQYKILTLVCAGCGKTFERTARQQNISDHAGSKRTFCSRHCYLDSPNGAVVAFGHFREDSDGVSGSKS